MCQESVDQSPACLLQTKELQEWAEDSEEFSHQTGQGVWQENLRTCAETLFSSLLGVMHCTFYRTV